MRSMVWMLVSSFLLSAVADVAPGQGALDDAWRGLASEDLEVRARAIDRFLTDPGAAAYLEERFIGPRGADGEGELGRIVERYVDLLGDDAYWERVAAEGALIRIGPQGLPFLLDRIEAGDLPFDVRERLDVVASEVLRRVEAEALGPAERLRRTQALLLLALRAGPGRDLAVRVAAGHRDRVVGHAAGTAIAFRVSDPFPLDADDPFPFPVDRPRAGSRPAGAIPGAAVDLAPGVTGGRGASWAALRLDQSVEARRRFGRRRPADDLEAWLDVRRRSVFAEDFEGGALRRRFEADTLSQHVQYVWPSQNVDQSEEERTLHPLDGREIVLRPGPPLEHEADGRPLPVSSQALLDLGQLARAYVPAGAYAPGEERTLPRESLERLVCFQTGWRRPRILQAAGATRLVEAGADGARFLAWFEFVARNPDPGQLEMESATVWTMVELLIDPASGRLLRHRTAGVLWADSGSPDGADEPTQLAGYFSAGYESR